MPSHFGGSTGKLRQTLHNITQSIDIINFGFLYLLLQSLYLFIFVCSHPCFLQVESACCGCPAHCEQHSIKLFWFAHFFCYLVLHHNLQLTSLSLLYADRQRGRYDIHLLLMQIGHDVVDHIPIKRTQVITSSHQTYVVTHSSQKASYLYCHISSSNNKCLTWWRFLIENLITGDSVFCALNLQIGGPRSGGNHKISSLDLVIQWILRVLLRQLSCLDVFMYKFAVFGTDDGIFILESGKAVEIVHVVYLVDVGDVSEIYGFDVSLYFTTQLIPVERCSQIVLVLPFIHPQFPSVVIGVDQLLVIFGRLVHQFFGNASHIHASTSQPPFHLVQTLLHKVDHYHVEPMLVGLEGSGKSTRPTSYNCEIIEMVISFGDCEWIPDEGVAAGHGHRAEQRSLDGGVKLRIVQKLRYFLPNHNQSYDQLGKQQKNDHNIQ